jgi:hypothetical protein
MTLDEKRALCDAKVTLDGKRAKVQGACRDFPRVTMLRSGLSVEFCWATVARVVARGGNFRSTI